MARACDSRHSHLARLREMGACLGGRGRGANECVEQDSWAVGASLTTAAFLRSTEQLEREIQKERLEEEEMMRELKRLRKEKKAEGSAKQPSATLRAALINKN